MSKNKKAKKQHTLLRGSGANLHTLYGSFKIDEEQTDFSKISVLQESELRHEQPNGSFAEHNTLKVNEGEWVLGKQVEYNPFKRTISQIWD